MIMSMSLNKKRKTENVTWLDQFPSEIIFDIFEYLQSNDIIFTFFDFNQRFQDLVMQQKYFEMPKTNLSFWRTTLDTIGPQIETLVINHGGLMLSLDLFPNVTSIIVTSPCFIDSKIIESIMKNDRFDQLHSLKIKQMILSDNNNNNQVFLKNIFNNQNQIEIFECPILGPSLSVGEPKFTSNLTKLRIKLNELAEIFSLFQYTPFLKYLNIIFNDVGIYNSQEKCSIQLERLHMMYNKAILSNKEYYPMTEMIKMFSASLKCLALNFSNIIFDLDNSLSNGEELRKQLLESLSSLIEFHFYTRTCWEFQSDILSTFRSQFWLDRNWIMATHGSQGYMYTLPFYFNEIHEFGDFTSVRTTNDKILLNNPYVWRKIQSIQLLEPSKIDFDLLRIQMPKLVSIYTDSDAKFIEMISKENVDVLNNVTIMNCLDYSLSKTDSFWFTKRASIFKYSPFDMQQMSSANSIILKNIQRLHIYHNQMKQFVDSDHVLFPNLEYLIIDHTNNSNDIFIYSSSVPSLLSKMNQLKTIFIYLSGMYNSDIHLKMNYDKNRMTTKYLLTILQFSISSDTAVIQDFPYWFQISKNILLSTDRE